MRMFLVCTLDGDFYPVEEVLDEGGAHQLVERHCHSYGEHHRDTIRWFCPEIEDLPEGAWLFDGYDAATDIKQILRDRGVEV